MNVNMFSLLTICSDSVVCDDASVSFVVSCFLKARYMSTAILRCILSCAFN